MHSRSLRICFPTWLCISFIVFSSAISACSTTPSSNLDPQTLTTSQAQNNFPSPSWWNGVCDTNNYSKSNDNSQHLTAYTLPKGAPVPANYRGVVACGPRPLSDHAPDVTVPYPGKGGNGYEWESTELSMRFMYLAYGIQPYYALSGADVVDNYKISNTNPLLVPVPNDGSSHTAPQPGDILSYNTADSPNHTSVVMASNVDSTGNGDITVLEQNFSPTGTATLSVGQKANKAPWVVAGVKNWLHHTVDLIPQTDLPGATVQVKGDGFGPDEMITITFDHSTLLGTTTAS